MDLNIFEQIGKSSKKVVFVYHLGLQNFDYLNEPASRIWEKDLPAILKSPKSLLHDVYPDDLPNLEQCYQELLAGNPQEFSIRVCFPDNFVKHLKADVYPLRNQENQVYALAGFLDDVTAHAQQVNYLKEFGQKKNSALEIVAHDLQGPLSIVKNISTLLGQDMENKLYDEVSTYIQLIQRAHDDCSNLIHSVLNDEHLKSPTIQVNKELVDAVGLVNAVADNYRMAPNVEVAIAVEAEKPNLELMLDQVKSAQIINNLISNSIKFTPPQGKINITLRMTARQLVMEHKDTGIGIPKELQPYIFERYSRASRTGLKGEKSTGIGLYIIKDLIEIQGGTITFESEENKGTTFTVTFPR